MSVVHGAVVVGVDGSGASNEALDWAVRHAEEERRALFVVHACGFPGGVGDFHDVVASERGLLSVGRSIARESVERVRRTTPVVGVESAVVLGNPATVLVEASETASLVVVGARGRGAVASVLLGSVSGVVTRDAHCPVVVARAGTSAAADADQPVVVGVDGTPVSVAAVEFAYRKAATEARPLVLLHASADVRSRISGVVDTRGYARRIALSEEEERRVAETVAGLAERYPDVAVTERYRQGDPIAALVAASREASLVVVGSRGRGLVRSAVLGSVSQGVLEQAHCPVAVARPVGVTVE